MYIAFEGIDGCGKTTLAREVNKIFPKFEIIKEPGGTDLGEKIRSLLLTNKKISVCSKAELFLFLADRAQLISEKIRPYNNIISDRSFISTIAYQSMNAMCSINTLWIMIEYALEIPNNNLFCIVPNIIFFIDLDIETCMFRIKNKSKDKIELRGKEYLETVRYTFSRLSKKDEMLLPHPQSKIGREIADSEFHILDGRLPVNKLLKIIKPIIEAKLKLEIKKSPEKLGFIE